MSMTNYLPQPTPPITPTLVSLVEIEDDCGYHRARYLTHPMSKAPFEHSIAGAISVVRLGSLMYVLDGSLRIEHAKVAGVTSLYAFVHEFEENQEEAAFVLLERTRRRLGLYEGGAARYQMNKIRGMFRRRDT